VRESKNDEIKLAHLVPEAVEALRGLKTPQRAVTPIRAAAGAVFTITGGKPLRKGLLEVRWNKIRTAAKLESRFRWHDLRHTTAGYLAQNGASLWEIQEVLGHKTARMSAKYAHLRPGAAVTGHTKIGELLRGK
jgi:integrase